MKYIGNQPGLEIVQSFSDKWDYVQAGNPTTSTNPDQLYAKWLNSSNGNEFLCIDNTPGANVWKLVSGYRGARVSNSVTQSVSNGVETTLSFDTEDVDTDGFHSLTVNPERLTVPAGVSRVRLTASISFNTNTSGYRQTTILRNNAMEKGLPSLLIPAPSGSGPVLNVSSDVLSVSEGDYFTLTAKQSSGSTLTVGWSSGTETLWFSIEVVE